MLVERSLKSALIDYAKGKKVVVLQCREDGRMDANLLSDFLEHDENKYLVDVPAVENPEFERAVQNMVSGMPTPEVIVQAVHETQEEAEEGKVSPPPREAPEVSKMPSAGGRKKKTCDPDVLRGYVESGKTDKEIAELEHVSLTVVKRWIKEGGLIGVRKKGRVPKPKPEKLEKAKKKPDAVPVIPGHNADRHLCKTCQYRGWPERGNGCDYIVHNPHSRSSICSIEDCNVYVKGPRLKKKKSIGLKGEMD